MLDITWTMNPFGGAVVDSDSLDLDPEVFSIQIDTALESWRRENVKVVWLKLPGGFIGVVPTAVQKGFQFHHANGNDAMLTLQVEKDAFIPPYSTHYVGIGGVVVNHNRELLVVSERYRTGGRGPSYKLPGGALQPGEHLEDAAVREIEEETGVKTKFEALVCFRHWHGYRYGKSDIYFVARLTPLSKEITMQVEEIAECLWMPVEEFLNSNAIHNFNKAIVQSSLLSEGMIAVEIEGYGPAEKFEFFMPQGIDSYSE